MKEFDTIGLDPAQCRRELLIGRSADIIDHDRTRLRWRSGRVTVNTHKVSCRTYDELYEVLNSDWRLLSLMTQK
jgi:hypothetical protein